MIKQYALCMSYAYRRESWWLWHKCLDAVICTHLGKCYRTSRRARVYAGGEVPQRAAAPRLFKQIIWFVDHYKVNYVLT